MKWHCISGTELLLFINTEKQHLVNALGLPATDDSHGVQVWTPAWASFSVLA